MPPDVSGGTDRNHTGSDDGDGDGRLPVTAA
jgi:hypothetical protein